MLTSHRRRNQQAAAAVIADSIESFAQENVVADPDEDTVSEVYLDSAAPSTGKFKTAVTNILSKHCSEVKNASDEIVQSSVSVARKKLKELVHKHNNEIFAFLARPDKTPHVLGIAEAIFRKYNHEAPSIKGCHPNTVLRDLNLDASMNVVVCEFDEGLQKQFVEGEAPGLQPFMRQLRWMFHQYKNIGEEVLRQETNLYQKLDHLDKLQQRMPLLTTLTANDALPELLQSFGKYAESVYQNMTIEEDYKTLVEMYKKWNICRQIISLQHTLNQDTTEPQCAICLLEPVSFVIVPCGHTFCSTCSKKQNTTCYICRGTIRERVKLYFT
jgi:hypothetical protein